MLLQLRLVIEEIELGRSARLVQKDDALRRGSEVRHAVDARGGESRAFKQRRERGDADALGGPAEKMPAGAIEFVHAYSFEIVSSRLRIALATTVHVASSPGWNMRS